MRRLRVLLLSTDLERGGLPLRLVQLARRLPGVDVEPVVGCLTRRGPLNQVIESYGIETFSCNAAGRFDARCLAVFAGHVRRLRPDLIHASLFHANLAARLAGRLDRPRPVLTSTVTIEIERQWHRALESMTAGLSDLHVANSEAVMRHLRDELCFPADQLAVVLNAVDFEAIKRTPPAMRDSIENRSEEGLVIWAGRMDPVKNLDAFVDVVERVSRVRRVRGLLLGDGPERARIESSVARRGLDGLIHVAGWRDDIVGRLKAADVLLFPSWTEGSPNVVLEAMASGCPVVTSDGAACRELLDRAGVGEMCHPADIPGLSAAVERALADGANARRRAAAGVERLRELHSFEGVVSQWRGVYDRLVGKSD